MKKVAVVVILLAAAWALGFWPQRSRRGDLEARQEQLARELAECQQRVRVAAVLGQLLHLRDAVAAHNFGIAQGLSSPFFDGVREEASRAAGTPFQPVLEEIQGMRDAVTSALTMADPGVQEPVRTIEHRLRAALGYTMTAQPAPAAPASPSPGSPTPEPPATPTPAGVSP